MKREINLPNKDNKKWNSLPREDSNKKQIPTLKYIALNPNSKHIVEPFKCPRTKWKDTSASKVGGNFFEIS